MSEQQTERPAPERQQHQVVVVGEDGQPVGTVDVPEADGNEERSPAELVEQPAKVMRIGSMVKQLLEEVRAAPLDDAARTRLREIHESSVRELSEGLAPELRAELERITLPFSGDEVPSDAELRIAQAQLVGWLEGLFHGIQTALFAQQMATKMAAERGGRALPGGPPQTMPLAGPGGTGQYL
ncbi:MAG: uncharacterized protein JWM64_788 [Frankiales bacterium]|nr:uncharacterized protein [Frankiales bacterium]